MNGVPMFDAEMKYCPKCNDEYMMVAERCAACDIPLLTGMEMMHFYEDVNGVRSARKGALTVRDDIVTIHQGSMSDLKQLQKLCEQENIGVAIISDSGGCGKG